MKSATSITLGLAALVNQAYGHYIFQQLTANGVQGAVYQNIRANTNYNSPVTDLASNDLRCNVGASGTGTSTTSVAAGSSVTITADIAVYHQGPVSFYMAKAPTTAAAFDGSGTVWYKIKDIGPTFSSSGATWDLSQSYSVTIPAATPNGDYLLRTQQLAIHNPWPGGIPQFYISCAQITITGGGTGSPNPLVAIPGAFKETDPGYTANIYNNFVNYTIPGPAVWNGAGGTGTGGGSSPTTTLVTSVKSTTTSNPATTTAASTGSVPLYGQCGGSGYTGSTVCAAGTCKFGNAFYSQCLP